MRMQATDRMVPSTKQTEVNICKGFTLEQKKKETAVAKIKVGLDFS